MLLEELEERMSELSDDFLDFMERMDRAAEGQEERPRGLPPTIASAILDVGLMVPTHTPFSYLSPHSFSFLATASFSSQVLASSLLPLHVPLLILQPLPPFATTCTHTPALHVHHF
jgi:hypothetical protein